MRGEEVKGGKFTLFIYLKQKQKGKKLVSNAVSAATELGVRFLLIYLDYI
jgi:hypothetical protein